MNVQDFHPGQLVLSRRNPAYYGLGQVRQVGRTEVGVDWQRYHSNVPCAHFPDELIPLEVSDADRHAD